MTRHAAEQGSELVGRLLAFARRQTLEPARVEIQNLSATVHRSACPHVSAAWSSSSGAPTRASGARSRTRRNSSSPDEPDHNARDAMPEGGTIAITGENKVADRDNVMGLPAGDYVVLAVADTGCGIAPKCSTR
jgi:hypothetical protein